jgi:hypothetical protein
MNIQAIKALTRRVRDRHGSNEAVAKAANIAPGVMSNYCSDEHPTTSIPIHRLLLIVNEAEADAFASILTNGRSGPPPADLLTETCEVAEDACDLQRAVREATSPNSPGGSNITPLEQRVIVQRAQGVQAQASDVIRAATGKRSAA